MPTQAEAVVIVSTGESYAILESVETMAARLREAGEHPADFQFIEVSPKEGGRALLNLARVVGFVSQTPEAG